jgi:hypothetical protein
MSAGQQFVMTQSGFEAAARKYLGRWHPEREYEKLVAIMQRHATFAKVSGPASIHADGCATPIVDQLFSDQLSEAAQPTEKPGPAHASSERGEAPKREQVVAWLKTLRENAHGNYNGGHHDDVPREAFHHGMDTICNVLDACLANWIESFDAGQRSVAAQSDETGWLIEKGQLCFGSSCNKPAWVTFTDPAAIRFARKIDAEHMLTSLRSMSNKGAFQNCTINEHAWIGPHPPTVAPQSEKEKP